MTESSESAQAQRVQEFIAAFQALRSEVGKVIVGHDEVVTPCSSASSPAATCCSKACPGLGKTLLVRTLAERLDLTFSRIQFTPDLMPADIIGTNMIVEDDGGPEAVRVPARPHLRQHRARRRGQPRHAEDAVRAARRHAGTQRHRVGDTPLAARRRSSCSPRRTRSRWRAPIRCPKRSSTASSSSCACQFPALDELVEILDRTTHGARRSPTGPDRPAGDRLSRARARDPDRVAPARLGVAHRARDASAGTARRTGRVDSSATARARAPRSRSSSARRSRPPEGRANVTEDDLRASPRPPSATASSSTSRARRRAWTWIG